MKLLEAERAERVIPLNLELHPPAGELQPPQPPVGEQPPPHPPAGEQPPPPELITGTFRIPPEGVVAEGNKIVFNVTVTTDTGHSEVLRLSTAVVCGILHITPVDLLTLVRSGDVELRYTLNMVINNNFNLWNRRRCKATVRRVDGRAYITSVPVRLGV